MFSSRLVSLDDLSLAEYGVVERDQSFCAVYFRPTFVRPTLP